MIPFCQTDSGREDEGYGHESHDCTVRALALLRDIPYQDAHRVLKNLGRRKGHGIQFRSNLRTLELEQCPDLCCRTLESIMPEMQAGRFIVRIHHHVFCVIDGTVHDTWPPNPRSRVKMVYQDKSPNRKETKP